MRSRAAILPFPGDPFLLFYWLHLFDKVWQDEVDRLYIYLNSPIEKQVVDYIREMCLQRPKINFVYNDVQIEHGEAINRTLDIVTEELVMLVEDDGFIFKQGAVDKCFRLLESGNYDIVGSKRGSCSTELLDRAKQIWDLSYDGEGDQGPNFWPNFFFCSKALLLKTDRNFASRAWVKGEIIHTLQDYPVEVAVVASDTFVSASFQLRNLIPAERIFYVPQYHGHPSDEEHFKQGRYLFDGRAPWCHIGSLSSGVGGLLRDDRNRCLTRRKIDPPQDKTILEPQWCQTDMERGEFERRVQWWQRFAMFWNENATKENPYMNDFWLVYTQAVDQIIRQYNLNRKAIMRRQDIYASLGL